MPILRFGDDAPFVYDFTASHVVMQGAEPHFGDVVPATTRLAGMSGGIDEYGFSPAPQAIGSIRQNLFLAAETDVALQGYIDDLMSMVDWPKVKLYYRPPTGGATRWCWARVNSARPMREEHEPIRRLWQPVTVVWQSNDPVWRSANGDYVYGGEGVVYGGDGIVYGGSALIEASGVETDKTVSNAGKATMQPELRVDIPVGESAEDVTIQRIVSGTVVDEVSYAGVLSAGDRLVIDARGSSVKLNGANAYDSNFDFDHHLWMRLLPGDNTLRVVMANAGDVANVRVTFDRGYY